jgi:TetR/AcrR family transcriptional regulator, repressor for neighboring sulfatase
VALTQPSAAKPRGREEIVAAVEDAAQRLFVSQGPARTSLRAIAKEANVTYGLVYRHFTSSSELLRSVLKRYSRQRLAMSLPSVDSAIEFQLDALVRNRSDFVTLVAWALLQGIPPEEVVDGMPGIQQTIRTFEQAYAAKPEPAMDPRIVVLLSACLLFGWQLFGKFLTKFTGLDDATPDTLLSELRAALYRLADLPQPQPPRDGT